jgi:IPT/TIG domain
VRGSKTRALAVVVTTLLALTSTGAPASASTAKPAVTKLSVASGVLKGGTRVTATGESFTHVTGVLFGKVRAHSFTVKSSTSLVAVAPKHAAGAVDVVVQTKAGTSKHVAKDRFTFVAPPVVTSISVATGPAAGGTRLTVKGHAFVGVVKVEFGTTTGKHLSVASAARLAVSTPAHPVGQVNVRVVTRYGTSAVVRADHFTFTGSASQPQPKPTPTPPVPSPTPTPTPTSGWVDRGDLPLPPDALPNPTPDLILNAYDVQAACWAPGQCIAAGSYVSTSDDLLGALWVFTQGAWSVQRAPLPANAADNPGAGPTTLITDTNPAACTTSGSCVVAGTYTAHVNGLDVDPVSLVWTYTGGSWSVRTLPVPADALPTARDGDGDAVVDQVACGATVCAARGVYDGPVGNLVVPISEAALWTWTSATGWVVTKPPEPADADLTHSSKVSALACEPTDVCAATGVYPTSSAPFGKDALWQLSTGTWSVTHVALPVNADGSDVESTPDPLLSCGSGGLCLGVMHQLSPNNGQSVLFELDHGTWSRVALPLPTDVKAASAQVYDQVSCTGGGLCAVVGTYIDANGNNQGALWTLVGGTWTVTRAPLTADAADNPVVLLTDVACSAAGVCLAQGSFLYQVGGSDADASSIWLYSGGTWSLVPTFADKPVDQVVRGLTCAPDLCAAWVSNPVAIWTITGGQWHSTQLYRIQVGPTAEMSCGPAGGCVAVDGLPHIWVYLE